MTNAVSVRWSMTVIMILKYTNAGRAVTGFMWIIRSDWVFLSARGAAMTWMRRMNWATAKIVSSSWLSILTEPGAAPMAKQFARAAHRLSEKAPRKCSIPNSAGIIEADQRHLSFCRTQAPSLNKVVTARF